MCEYFSLIVTDKFEALWLKEHTDDHQAIIDFYKLEKETDVENRQYVKIEITPKEKAKISRVQSDWQFNFDTNDNVLPIWVRKNKAKVCKVAWEAWEKSVNLNLLLGSEKLEVNDGRKVFAYDHASIVASGSVSIEASDSVSIKASDSWHGQCKLITETATLIWRNTIYVQNLANVKDKIPKVIIPKVILQE